MKNYFHINLIIFFTTCLSPQAMHDDICCENRKIIEELLQPAPGYTSNSDFYTRSSDGVIFSYNPSSKSIKNLESEEEIFLDLPTGCIFDAMQVLSKDKILVTIGKPYKNEPNLLSRFSLIVIDLKEKTSTIIPKGEYSNVSLEEVHPKNPNLLFLSFTDIDLEKKEELQKQKKLLEERKQTLLQNSLFSSFTPIFQKDLLDTEEVKSNTLHNEEISTIENEIIELNLQIEKLPNALLDKLVLYDISTSNSSVIAYNSFTPILDDDGNVIYLTEDSEKKQTIYSYEEGKITPIFSLEKQRKRRIINSCSHKGEIIILSREGKLDKWVPKRVLLPKSEFDSITEEFCLPMEEMKLLTHDVILFIPDFGYFTASLEKPFVAISNEADFFQNFTTTMLKEKNIKLPSHNPYSFVSIMNFNKEKIKKTFENGMIIAAKNIFRNMDFFSVKLEKDDLLIKKMPHPDPIRNRNISKISCSTRIFSKELPNIGLMDGYITEGAQKSEATLINIHGGPHAISKKNHVDFFIAMHNLTALNLNFPGSEGRGKKYQDWVDGRWSKIPGLLQQAAEELGYKSYIPFGCSFGAYAALKFLEYYPKQTPCVFAINGTYDLVDDQKQILSSIDLNEWTKQMGGYYMDEEGLKHLMQESVHPEHLSKDVPIFLMYGLDDKICLPRQSSNLAKSIAENKGQVFSISLKNEGHSWSNHLSTYLEMSLLDGIVHKVTEKTIGSKILKLLSVKSGTSLEEFGYPHATVEVNTLNLDKWI